MRGGSGAGSGGNGRLLRTSQAAPPARPRRVAAMSRLRERADTCRRPKVIRPLSHSRGNHAVTAGNRHPRPGWIAWRR
ncbi:hypothetical protein NFA_730 [Nocardia farcinica IFM 10152]|uniref:Uncharacterized protein n=1 Tax=Nocardia farcinica (strain IFM 10152) TaxID=247156 RepID=Q5Z3S6_NOCFA|nr:hypothetical protein NFA_730 [Nocardia farcinica IFM 10152]